MSFYGNITNTSRSQFQFDRIYANRWEMESNKYEDGIYAGRYVLVEYDSQLHMDSILRVNKKVIDDNTFYLYNMTDGEPSPETLLTKNNTNKNDLVYSSDLVKNPEHGYYAKNCVFYKCISDKEVGNNEPAVFMEIVDGTVEDDYVINYNIDKKNYNRGYDSTVWQKVYVNGEEHYLMVAELNTVIPVFALQPDAPTQSPAIPHFDKESTDLYYKLHYQPSWGMRVKSARIEAGPAFDNTGKSIKDSTVVYTTESPILPQKSDETTIWTREEYDHNVGQTKVLYWHPKDAIEQIFEEVGLITEWEFNNSIYYILNENKSYEVADFYDSNTIYYKLINYSTGEWNLIKPEKDEEVPAAIYYNKAGFNPERISIDTEDDSIKIAPTGKSGHQYNKHNNSTTEVIAQPDIQEISIMLPSIGTSIAKVWDIVYGDEEQNNSLNRNLDIMWDSTEGLRLVKELKDGNGFTYDSKQVNTIAGAINSVHDLMGMIIKDENIFEDNFANNANEKNIYYYNGKYYRKVIEYDYSVKDLKNIYQEKGTINFEDFEPNYYYTNNNNEYILATEWVEGQIYYIISHQEIPESINSGYQSVPWSFDSFDANKFYYGNEKLYILEKNNYPSNNRNYITLNDPEDQMFSEIPLLFYNTTDYFKNISPNKYQNCNNFEPQATYYTFTEKQNIDINNEGSLPYIKNHYYYYNKGEQIPDEDIDGQILTKLTLETEDSPQEKYNYYTITVQDGNLYVQLQPVYEWDKNHYYYTENNNKQITYVKCTSELKWEDLINENNYFCSVVCTEIQDTFYQPNKYYTCEKEIEYHLSQEEYQEQPNNVQFYKISNNIKNVILEPLEYLADWRSGKLITEHYFMNYSYYYKLDNNQYVLDHNNIPVDGRNYYIRENVLYVLRDGNGHYGLGAEWNPNIFNVPSDIILATRKEKPIMKELDGFARELNTIHGLILQINKMLLIDDAHTRDRKTVQGSINMLNDIIAKFEIIAPNQIMIVDDYGRVHSAPYTTAQEFETNHYQHGTPVNPTVIEKTIIESTEDRWINMEIDTNVKNPKISIKHNFTEVPNTTTKTAHDDTSGQLELFTPIVDNMGHIVGNNIETVELPHNFKFITVNDNQDEILEADNHMANFNINGDEWINLTPTKSNNTIKITHEYPKQETDKTIIVPIDLNNNGDFEIETNNYDNKGHFIRKDKQSIRMPHNFKFISIDNETDNKKWITADNHVAKFNITNGDRWIDLSIHPEEDTIKIYHAVAGGETDTHVYEFNTLLFGGTFEVPIITKDKMGHITEISNHTVQLPPFKVNNNNIGNVLVDLSLDLTSRESSINLTTANLGALTLNNYDIGTSIDAIVSSDTLSAGLGKLELRLNKISGDLTSLSGDFDLLTGRIKVLEDADYTKQIQDLEARIAILEGNPTV